MTEPYTQYHPRWYRPHVSTYWWIGQRHYLKFILRELSSVAVAWFVILTLFQIRALLAGAEAYARFVKLLHAPWMIALNLFAFGFVIFHTITWFNLAPRAMPVRLRGKRVPEYLVAAPNYGLWVVVSLGVAWILMRKP